MRTVITMIALGLALLTAPAGAQEPDARTTLPNGERALRTQVMVPASPGEVWEAWTTPDGVRAFLGVNSKIELRLGGPYELYFAPDAPEGERGGEGCTVLSYLPHRMLSFTWNAPPKFPEIRRERTIVVVEIDEIAPGAVRVRLTQHGWGEGEQWDGVYEYFARAWPYVLGALRDHFAGEDRGQPWRDGWIYLIEPKRDGAAMEPTDEEARLFGAHFRYLQRLMSEGKVILAGPVTDMEHPGIVIFYAEDEEAARAIMEGDPGVKGGLFEASVHPMRLSLLRERDLP